MAGPEGQGLLPVEQGLPGAVGEAVEDWDDSVDTPYRVVYSMFGETYTYDGTVRKDPKDKAKIVVAAFTGKGLLDRAYQEAIQREYRVYSFGDAMLIL